MDYHFLRPKRVREQPVNSSYIFKLVGRFLPVFLLAAILPFLIGFVVAPPDISFLTRADATSELRVWVEPANVVMSPGGTTEFTVLAQFEGEEKLIPEITLTLTASSGLVLENKSVTYKVPFNGRVELGRVGVRAESAGEAMVDISRESIKITAFEWPLEVSTAPAKVIIR
ncbi:hypothetical protein A2803_02815 [Candidatus Woesebacteria bacterium RIFCSPHIGHO2_01_FULL_44_21]|uniref:Cohesin domain-containing protein n=1 Tax=Candidatus Woesebacteria bacterium RIFCSPHIGHO2_01_FULL_44_21 TaxID=1802503 RepID=A0A1F7YXJ6_9BACT|nr:MAG: hypothetical protein A2803_02815 [Candidatus Woesebacteria bacterium RIFCSPHIGHO2_01_FULL_44_21]OGM69795.1 MAG: hypothetical protein A2897_00430 [Candidatus Woesebacteria bacterium RIFCSPLOWO2_01_FULL_44_24b]